LNVATTRLILTRAETAGLSAAGGVIKNFADFVAADKIVVGLIIFVIIVVIQFLVITKGATRISEVAARFNLDGMPGRQMAIDADLNAGIIDEHEALRRRQEIARQAEFYGAMDGASKFVRGDAIAGIVIIVVNILGGLFIGVFEAGMSVGAASALFTKLTIGDGLVSQVPAFLISLAAGLLVTRSTERVNLPSEFIRQLFSRPQALAVAGGFVGVLVFTSLRSIPLALIGASCVALAILISRRTARDEASKEAKTRADAAKKPAERVEDYLIVEPMDMEIGVGLIRLADRSRGGDLLDRIHRVRKEVAGQIGIILPKVRIRDNFQLGQNQYRIKIAGVAVAEGVVKPGMLMAIDSGETSAQVTGTPTQDPAFGTPALWISPTARDEAKSCGYTVVEPGAVLATHLLETVRKHADEILTRDAARHLIDQLRETSPAVVEELIPDVMRLAEVQQILQMLLREQVPIRQLGVILETLGDYAARTKDPILLTKFVRERLSRTISARYRNAENRLYVVTLDPELEDRISAGFEHTEQGLFIRMSPQAVEATCRKIAEQIDELRATGHPPILLASPQIRAALKEITSLHLPNLIVLSYNEITRDTRVESVAMSAAVR
ncbi:MAG: FHIPEP family type III secretion protein, partial [Planctomycetes bacterium]|nr:FHIPEP family type III secretion protein [Planctomycetota bacterium]